MARNGSGSYSLPSGNPVVAGTTITTAWANDTLDDVATEVTDSLSRSGKGGMLAPLEVVDGSEAAPGITFGSEPSSGIYRAGAGDVRVSILGTDSVRITDSGFEMIATDNDSGLVGGTNWTITEARLRKLAGNLVFFSCRATLSSASGASTYPVTLPEGYRPAVKIAIAAKAWTPTPETVHAWLDTDGTVFPYVGLVDGYEYTFTSFFLTD